MKQALKLSFKRSIAFTGALIVLGTAILSTVMVLVASNTAHAQQGGVQTGYYWINAGTIKFNNQTFYDSNALDSNHEFILAGSGTCSYQYSNITNLPMDRLVLSADGSVGSRWVVDPANKDATNTLTCKGIETKIQLYDIAKSKFYLYRKGDVIYTYNNAMSFVKSGQPGGGGTELFLRDSEIGVQCADVIVHGTGGDFNGWFIFPMAPKGSDFDGEAGTAVSERYGIVTNTGQGSMTACRVRGVEIENPMKIGTRSIVGGCDPRINENCIGDNYDRTGIDNNLFAYKDYSVPGGWGDDGYSINAGMGTEDSAPPADSPPPGDGETANLGQPTPNTCDVAFTVTSILTLKWIVCPILDGTFAIVRVVDDILNSQLQLDMSPFDDDSPFHLAWNAFRVLALGIIVIVALVMVITQATGIELFSAYTTKKLAGQFALAVILISLSWDLSKLAFQASNDIAEGIRTIIYMPFHAFPAEQLGGGSAWSMVLLATGAILFLGPFGILSFAVTAALSIAVTVLVLVLLHSVTYVVVMTIPVGIACSVLPNTRKVYEVTKGAFVVFWLLAPAISIAVAGLRAVSVATYHLKGGNATINQIAATFEYLGADWVAIWVASRLGGAVGNITGMINDRGRGAFDRLKKFRQGQVSKNTAAMAAGERFNHNIGGFNTMTKGAAAWYNADNKGAFLSLSRDRRRAARSAAMEQHENILSARYGKTEKAQVAQHNDGLLQAQTYASEAEARQNMANDWGMSQEDAMKNIEAARVNGGFSKQRQINAARRLAATGTGYSGLGQLHDTIARVAGSNSNMASSLLGDINASTKGVGRHDLAAGYGKQMELYNARMSQGSLTSAQLNSGYVSAAKETDAVTMGRDKGGSLNNVAPAVRQALDKQREVIHDTTSSAAAKQAARVEAAKLSGMIETYSQNSTYFSANNTEKLAQGAVIPTAPMRQTVREAGNQREYMYETVQQRDASGAPVVDAAGRPVIIEQRQVAGVAPNGDPIYQRNPEYNKEVVDTYQSQAPRNAPYNRDNDPRL